MKIGLIDVDGHNFPNLPLMKLSAYHKQRGDVVEWYDALCGGWYDRIYMSKVFSFTPDYMYPLNADKVVRGGSGYAIHSESGKECYIKSEDIDLKPEIEHIYPDYGLYPELTKDTAYGFLTRGCPRGCDFCHVKDKEGHKSYKVADLSEFWHGQKYIVLLDPNLIACKDWKSLLQQLIDSKSYVDISQGVDIRMMTDEKAEYIKQIKIKSIHFAWDRYEDKAKIVPKFKYFADITGWGRAKMIVYILCNYNTSIAQDLDRIYTLRDMGYSPYVMIYNKEQTKSTDTIRRIQRWTNSPYIFNRVKDFNDYK